MAKIGNLERVTKWRSASLLRPSNYGHVFRYTLALYWLIVFGYLPQALSEGVRVQSTVDRNEVELGESLTLTVSITTGESATIGEPRLPDLGGFELVNRHQSLSSQSIFSNGQFQFIRTQNFNYVLSPTKEGKLTIGKVDVLAGNQTYSTQPITITVKPSVGGAPPQRQPPQFMADEDSVDPLEEADELFNQLLQRRGVPTQPNPQAPPQNVNPNEAFFVQLVVDKETVYEGEQVTATWYLYTRSDIRDMDTLKYPSLTGFWKEDIEVATNLNFQSEVINGIAYRRALLASYALFPIKSGTATIDPYKARCTVLVRSFGGFFGQPYTFTKASQPKKITVLPLPVERPKSFSGAVGQFNIRLYVDKTTVPANEPFSLKVRFEGRGNGKLIEAPTIKLPDTFEQFDTRNESKFMQDGTSFKEFEYLFVPRVKGDYTIPSFEFSYFDSKRKQFVTSQSDPIRLSVVEGKAGNSGGNNQRLQSESKKTESKKELPGLVLKADNFAFLNVLTLPVWGVIYLISLVLMGLFSYKTLGSNEKTVILSQKLIDGFRVIEKLASQKDFRKVGAQTVNIVYRLVGEMCVETQSYESSNDSISHLLSLTPPSVKKELNGHLIEQLKYFEALAFAPDTVFEQMKDAKVLQTKLSDLKKILKKAVSVYETKTEG